MVWPCIQFCVGVGMMTNSPCSRTLSSTRRRRQISRLAMARTWVR